MSHFDLKPADLKMLFIVSNGRVHRQLNSI